MGFAHGALFPSEAQAMLNRTWAYMVSQVEGGLAFLPAWLAELIGDVALDVALDVLIDLTKPSTGAYIYEELHGLADGAGIDYEMLARVHLIGELTQGDCSLIGAWGAATAGAKTLQLRALDWDTVSERDRPRRHYAALQRRASLEHRLSYIPPFPLSCLLRFPCFVAPGWAVP